MIKEVNQACKKLNKTLGISVTLPNPNQKTLKTASTGNFLIGSALIAAGILFSSKSCTALGGLSVISSIILRKESNNKENNKWK